MEMSDYLNRVHKFISFYCRVSPSLNKVDYDTIIIITVLGFKKMLEQQHTYFVIVYKFFSVAQNMFINQ